MKKIIYFAFSEYYEAKHAGFTHALNITKSMTKKDIHVDLFFKYNKTGIISEDKKLIIHGVQLPDIKTLFKLKLITWYKSYNYIKNITKNSQLIYERFHINPIDLLFINKNPYILEINDPTFLLYNGIKKMFYKKIVMKKIKRCSIIITQTNTLKFILKKFTDKKIYVIPNGVDTKKFNPEIKSDVRKKYNIGEFPLITFVGAFMQWHGVDSIIKIAEDIPEAKFLLVGDGPLYQEIKERTKNVRNIIIIGAVNNNNIPGFLACSDVLIAPFNTKRFNKLQDYGFWWCPVKLFEYMASGRPIVSYDFSEVKNIVKDSAILAKQGSLNDFINCIKLLLADKNKRENLGRKARKISLGYTWDKRGEDIIKIIGKLI